MKDIIEGLKVIHENGYHHGNVRFSNIFANPSSYILSDYYSYLLYGGEKVKEDKEEDGDDNENKKKKRKKLK